MINLIENCPCGSTNAFNLCCGRYLLLTTSKPSVPQTAEALMRSRYTAFVKGNELYLSQTWHPTTRPTQILGDQSNIKWVDLKIINTINGKPDDNEGVVEFEARYKSNGKMTKLHEVSRFIKEDAQWFYLDGALDGVLNGTG